jgi:uncharacterized membrane protein
MRTAKEFRDTAWNILRGRYWWTVLAALIVALIGGYGSGGNVSFRFNADNLQQMQDFFVRLDPETGLAVYRSLMGVFTAIAGFAVAYGIALFIVGSAVELGYNLLNIQLFESSDRPKIETIFSRFSYFGNALLLRLLMFIKIFLWTLLLIVPGIVASFRYALAPYLMAEHPDLTPTEAVEQSKQLMQGNKARLFWLKLSFIGWYLLSALTMGIGWVFLAPYPKAAEAAFYLELTGRLPLNGTTSSASETIPPQAPTGHELI